jgi:hypothetical protein
MKLPIAPVALVFASLAVASESTWPNKGDTVFISASFKGLNPPPLVAGAKVNFDMPPCAEVEIVKATPQKNQWTMRDPLNGKESLVGAWLVRMHKSKSECEAQLSAQGEPVVERSGTTFTIKPQGTK